MARLKINIDQDIRLALLQPEDATALLALINYNEKHLTPMSPRLAGLKLDGALGMIERNQQRCAAGTDLQLGIYYQGHLAGHVSLRNLKDAEGTAQLGYWVGIEDQGKGIATKAADGLLRYAARKYKLRRAQMEIATDNARSLAVASRLGFDRGSDFQGKRFYSKTL